MDEDIAVDDTAYDPLKLDQKNEPWAIYRSMRETCPVHHATSLDLWTISRYDDVVAAARDTARLSSATSAQPMDFNYTAAAMAELDGCPTSFPMAPGLQSTDPPQHGPNRKIFNVAFSPRRVEAMDPFLRTVAADLIDRMVDKRDVDFVADYAVPLPIQAIGHVLGFGPDEVGDLKRWSTLLIGAFDPNLPPEAQVDTMRGVRDWAVRIAEVVEDRRAHPKDDFMSVLATTEREDGSRFSMSEIVVLATETLVGGNETTTNLLASMIYCLANDAETLHTLTAGSRELRTRFVEESLRWSSPVTGLFRVATQPVAIADTVIPAGVKVQLLWAAANHDDNEFPEPERFDVDRPNVRHHLSFGSGPHVCAGAPLARLEARITLEELLPRIRGIRLADGFTPRWGATIFTRGLTELPVEFDVND